MATKDLERKYKKFKSVRNIQIFLDNFYKYIFFLLNNMFSIFMHYYYYYYYLFLDRFIYY